MKNTKGAMEMSVGTIVTIVLLMSVLILGLVLVKNIFKGAGDATDTTISQLNAETAKLFGDTNEKVLLTPSSGEINVKAGKTGAFGISIKNRATSLDQGTEFSYEVIPVENTCGLTLSQMDSLIFTGKTHTFSIPVSDVESWKVEFSIPESGIPDCGLVYKAEVKRGSEPYKTTRLDVKASA